MCSASSQSSQSSYSLSSHNRKQTHPIKGFLLPHSIVPFLLSLLRGFLLRQSSLMASSLGIACGGNNHVAANLGIQKRCDFVRAPPSSVAIGDRPRSTARKGRISAVTAATAKAKARGQENRIPLELHGKREGGASDAVEAQERLDEWMRDSVVEIVKNLKEAPLLVQVYPKRNNKGEETTLTTEKKVVVEDWFDVKERWNAGEAPVPEGVIFVEELGDDEAEKEGKREIEERTTKAWGIVVQGKGVGCGPVCYLLKTSRVGSGPGPGVGICSTHFCLMRVKNFEETVQSQLKNCWLLQSQWQ